jgi:hypothetical protein
MRDGQILAFAPTKDEDFPNIVPVVYTINNALAKTHRKQKQEAQVLVWTRRSYLHDGTTTHLVHGPNFGLDHVARTSHIDPVGPLGRTGVKDEVRVGSRKEPHVVAVGY